MWSFFAESDPVGCTFSVNFPDPTGLPIGNKLFRLTFPTRSDHHEDDSPEQAKHGRHYQYDSGTSYSQKYAQNHASVGRWSEVVWELFCGIRSGRIRKVDGKSPSTSIACGNRVGIRTNLKCTQLSVERCAGANTFGALFRSLNCVQE